MPREPIKQEDAEQIIESLRKGMPPIHGVNYFSVGNEKLLKGIKKFHLKGLGNKGIIRFISGSWGSGKTHFFSLVRELAFEEGCLISNVQLTADSAALNKFEQVFAEIVRKIATPTSYSQNQDSSVYSYRYLLSESLNYLANGKSISKSVVTHEEYVMAKDKLMADQSIDIDFRKMIAAYWSTFLPDSVGGNQDQRRAEILQWFIGEGKISQYKGFQIAKIINKENSKLMLQSLGNFVKLSGYKGLVILFDEAEQSYSVMSKSALKNAQNNLLALINNIEQLPGLFLIYATTPDFYNDPKHGIQQYGALAARLGQPEQQPPRALKKVWNLDANEVNLSDYQVAASKILDIYTAAYPDDSDELPSESKVKEFVSRLHSEHSEFSGVNFWRVMVASLIAYFDDCMEGEERDVEEVYISVMATIKDE
ncbi:BREX system ATP-binding domain-containing protein [Prochlorothrix hollandica]|nr:BREX system ATP-binding domain-containing protein [Prochlorothrix hollandica]